tara:strand:- start:318 stop:1271 length:954 start_codon:yes stop_codon:yes gene_type:complete
MAWLYYYFWTNLMHNVLQTNHIFRNSHPGIAVFLFFCTATGTAILNFLRQPDVFIFSFGFWIAPFSIGVASWLINVILVYRSRYLLSNYLLGWSWWCLLVALTNSPITWKEALLSVGASVWLAIAFELYDERKIGLRTRSNLGFFAAFLGILNPHLFSLVIPSVLAPSVEFKFSLRPILQIFIAWILPVALFFVFGIGSLDLIISSIIRSSENIFFQPPSLGELIILFWAIFAFLQTIHALVRAKKAKRRGLMLSWLGIIYAILLSILIHDSISYASLMAVFFGPHLVNLKDYISPKRFRYLLTPSLLLGALIEIIL